MFTTEQIKEAHSRVKTGADFPSYIQDMKKLGILSYEHFVADGHIIYHGNSDFTLTAPPKWVEVPIAPKGQVEKLEWEIKIHQEGRTDYPTFCRRSAEAGVEKWVVDMQKMMCTYYDQSGSEMVAEPIPDARAYAR
jgi:uncharacterized protein YbcV (DUF1398 family)